LAGQDSAGQVSDASLTSMDLLPLFCSLAGVELPTDRKIDGKNIFPILQGNETETPHKMLYYYNGTNLQAVREGNWKLHLPRTLKGQPFWSKEPRHTWKGFVKLDDFQLFDLNNDLGEKRNVADRYTCPSSFQVLQELLTGHKARCLGRDHHRNERLVYSWVDGAIYAPKAWLRQVLSHCLSHAVEKNIYAQKRDLRREVSIEQVARQLDDSMARMTGQFADPAATPSQIVGQRELAAELSDQLAKLKPSYRDVIVYRNLQGLSFNEAAERMEIKSGAARMLRARAIAKFKEVCDMNHGGESL
jgi:RNA polymerase sigma-70 factor (subfamily 1)